MVENGQWQVNKGGLERGPEGDYIMVCVVVGGREE